MMPGAGRTAIGRYKVKPAVKSAALTLAVFSVFVLSGCGTSPVVGILLPTTGSASDYGESMKNGIELALEFDQEVVPADYEVLWADTASDPQTGAAELKRLADQGAKIFVAGTTSATAAALLPMLDDTDTIAVSPSASAPQLTKDSRRFFRVFASDELEGRRAGRFLYDDRDKTSVLIYSSDSAQAHGIEPPFRLVFEQAMGGKIVGRVVIGSENWQEESADLLAAGAPEAVYVIGYSDTTVQALQHLREKGYDGLICATSAFYTADVLVEHPDLVEGVFFPQPAFDMKSDSQLVQDFVTTYRQRFGGDPDIYAAHAFDAMRVVNWASAKTKRFSATDLRKALAFEIKEFPGVTGIIQFNDYGDVHHNPIMFIIRNGEVLNYERYIEEEKAKIRERIKDLLGGN
jgi:branched-chain amino acid transport system substrate-binding protein